MDPVTHALLGAAVAQTVFSDTPGPRALIVGAIAGVLPDADVLTRFFSDPALPWEVHRHLTHAVAFMPVGGLLTALPFLTRTWWRQRWRTTVVAATLAYATHGFLDACTSYGTHLLLPFSTDRTAWDIIAIVDPIFTAILLVALTWTLWRSRTAPAIIALLLCAGYIGIGVRQHGTALEALAGMAESRGHAVVRARAMPTPGNLVVWRGLYVADGRIHADAVRVPVLGRPHVRPGVSIALFRPEELDDSPEATQHRARIADIVNRFDLFADGFVARDPGQPDVLADMRYSLEAAAFAPLWGIRLDPEAAGEPVSWVDLVTDRRASMRRMWIDLRRE